MYNHRFLICILLLLFVVSITACGQNETSNKALFTETNNEGVSVYFNDQIRFKGGKPQLENETSGFDSICLSGEECNFMNDQTSNIKAEIKQYNENVWSLSLSLSEMENWNGKKFAGFFFDSILTFTHGVEFWRYKPWNSWTKPIKVKSIAELHDWDVQFFYWKYSDGTYGAAIPLSGNGYRTTLGSNDGHFGCKAYTYTDNAPTKNIPMMALGFGENPQELFLNLYHTGLEIMGKAENIREKKSYPEAMEYIGWCTWNSSHNGQYLDEKHLLEGVSTFTENEFPLGWLLIDDGWFNHDGRRLNDFKPNAQKFPVGFKSLVSKLKTEHKLKHVGIWHAYNGYWNGINPESELGKQYQDELFSWTQIEEIHIPDSKKVTYSFIRPDSDSLLTFYDNWHRYFADQGFSFIKVDNQLVSERMCVDNYPISYLSEKMHQALYASVDKYFDGAIINCMDMTNEAFYNFGESAIARCVEDYFPEADGGIGYDLERGGAAAHVLAALYNSLYFSQMVWPDFDMFESYNTNAVFHAVARAISGGPIYLTDTPGKQNFETLWPLIDADGRILRADQPAFLTEDCLFQVQDKKPLKAFSFAGDAGLLAVFNAADADTVSGQISPLDVDGIEGESFAVYEFFSGELNVMNRNGKLPIELKRMECNYFNLIPIQNGIALIGLVNKYNAPKTIISSVVENHKITVELNGGGTFKALLPQQAISVFLNGESTSYFKFEKNVFTVEVGDRRSKEMVLEINF